MKCNKCGSKDIRQQISLLVDPNDDECIALLEASDFVWDDYFYCMECVDECEIIEDDKRFDCSGK